VDSSFGAQTLFKERKKLTSALEDLTGSNLQIGYYWNNVEMHAKILQETPTSSSRIRTDNLSDERWTLPWS
jgi:hypothetical protein